MSTFLPPSDQGGQDGSRRSLRPLTPRTAFRIATLGVIAMGAVGILVVRLWFLQVIGGQAYAQKATSNIVRTIVTPAPRGLITDRNGMVLAQNRPSTDLVAFPRELRDIPHGDQRRTRVLKKLAPIIGADWKHLRRLMHDGELNYPYQPVVLARDLPVGKAMPLGERIRDFPGLQLRDSFVREYPHGDLAANVLGYIGAIPDKQWNTYKAQGYQRNDRVGLAGIEKQYEQYLRGINGERQVEVDAFGNQVGREFGTKPPQQGKNLQLTIDANVERVLQDQLAERARLFGTAAAGVVMDPRNGDILALGSYPTFLPDDFARGKSRAIKAYFKASETTTPMLDRATQGQYPPASTFKPITALSALKDGILSPTEPIDSPSKIVLFKRVYHNYKNASHGQITLPTALEVSSDTYFFQVGWRYYKSRTPFQQIFWDNKFGFGQPTHIDLPEEYPGRVPTPEWKKSYLGKIYPDEATWKGGDDINMAVGQGNLTVTPLQMAVAYSAIANGGTMLTPVVGRQVSDSTGQVVRHITPAMPPRKLDIPARLFDPVHQGLINVTQNGNGTANGVFSGIASAANIVVAGKTGTAENLPHKDHAWFVGYAPAEHPSVVVAIVVQNGGTGAVAAAPAVCRTIAAVPGTRFDPNLCGTPTQTVSN